MLKSEIAHLQRVHNEKSVKPLPQIDLVDRQLQKFIHVQNNGVGPFIVKELVFIKDKQIFFRIEDCLAFEPKSYDHIKISKSNSKVIPPGRGLHSPKSSMKVKAPKEMHTGSSYLSCR